MAKRVLLAAPRGYCAGVDRAVITVEKALELYGAPVYVRKQIVHNVHVVASLESKGAIFVDETDEVPEGKTVVFSAHGVAPLVHQQAAARSLKTIDATCPLVTKVHMEAKRFAAEDAEILLIGHHGHEEVVAPQADLVIVVGSKNSSNSVRLVEVALEYGAKASYLVDYAEQIQDEWLSGVETIGLTSGASVPEILVTDVLKTLAEHGYSDVETITAMEESLLFALPPELRKDMKAAGQV
ncbi:MAG: 4-hydroxy-3-methylbut-2-enyl diphosphate reductase [Actinobacteria bacterium]|nr:4-hydroxy-3-methylbut-2-enyl diphosphate reductase [Actinomycetota bacterium]